MNINLIKQLRYETGAGYLNCQNALFNSKEDIEKAKLWLRENVKHNYNRPKLKFFDTYILEHYKKQEPSNITIETLIGQILYLQQHIGDTWKTLDDYKKLQLDYSRLQEEFELMEQRVFGLQLQVQMLTNSTGRNE